MKLPRNAKLLRNQLDMAPFAAVFFLLVILLMLGALMPMPGIRLPMADNLPALDQPTVTVAVDASNRLFFANQIVNETELKARLKEAVNKSSEPLTLVVRADESLTSKELFHLIALSRDAGIQDAFLAAQPRVVTAPASGASARP